MELEQSDSEAAYDRWTVFVVAGNKTMKIDTVKWAYKELVKRGILDVGLAVKTDDLKAALLNFISENDDIQRTIQR